MNPRTVTDTLPELIESAWNNITAEIKRYHAEHPNIDCPDWGLLDYSGTMHEIIDSTVPTSTYNLNELAHFHHTEAMRASKDQFGSVNGNWLTGQFAAGLYCLIKQACMDRFANKAWNIWESLKSETARKRP